VYLILSFNIGYLTSENFITLPIIMHEGKKRGQGMKEGPRSGDDFRDFFIY
jgi:hypothetical protein